MMTREQLVCEPQSTGSVRVLGPVDIDTLITSLDSFIQKAKAGERQQGLRWAGETEGVGRLMYGNQPTLIKQSDFNHWIEGTEELQKIAKAYNARDTGRVRMLTLQPNSCYSFHADKDGWRLHIPLVTNVDSFLVVDGKLWHLPVGNIYLIKVLDFHCAMNAGTESRVHIVFDWCDHLA